MEEVRRDVLRVPLLRVDQRGIGDPGVRRGEVCQDGHALEGS